MTKLKSGAEVEIYYFICFILCFFLYGFMQTHTEKESKFPRYIFLFVSFCVFWMYIVSETFRGENLSLFWKTVILPDESVGICVRMKKKDETLFHALLLPSVFTKWTLFSCRII